MKKRFYLVLTIFSLALINVQAQDGQNSTSGMRFGGKAGINLATLGGTTSYSSYSMKPGLHLGAVLEIPFNDEILLQPEFLISQQGSGGYLNDNLNLWYASIPLMGKYNVWDALYVEAGPQIGVLFAENTNEAYLGENLTVQQNPDFDTNTLDIGINVGAGYELNENLYFQARFNIGFINAIKDVNSKNRVFQISAIYFL
ncbi:outer membrane beta-barrel protein [Kriegella sp. EG-1]|nr:outer membrane beta-barrel protein [Flavobacteriaceae bacterium EG-1]